MSLAFVSKTVQTATNDGGFQEEAIDRGDDEQNGSNAGRGGPAKPLFEQLRKNKEQEEEEREEFQRSVMRGTLALDDEDCAHLDAVRKQREEQDKRLQQQTQDDLAVFRAAQADLMEQQQQVVAKYDENTRKIDKEPEAVSEDIRAEKPSNRPKITVKKRRRKQETILEPKKAKVEPVEEGNGLVGLLTGYGSSSDDEDDW